MVELSLADLIDLELELQRDRSRPIEVLHERDARLARQIAAEAGGEPLDGRALVLAWLRCLQREGEASSGARVASFLELLGVVLFVLGLVSGAATVTGWLEVGDGRPVNVVNFWSLLVGAQLLLLVGWLASTRRDVLRGLGGLFPSLVGFALTRLGSRRDSLAETFGELRKLDWLYRRLSFWRTTALSQGFAVAFNLGAVGALVAIPYLDDPAFGWRSRLLDDRQLHAIAGILALPWSQLVSEGVPSAEEVAGTQYSSVDPRFSGAMDGPADGAIWASWWPFLVASLSCYGLLPRLLLWSLALYRGRRELSRAALDHADYQRLRERLLRPSVDTRAPDAGNGLRPAAAALPARERTRLDGGPVLVLRWEGVTLGNERIHSLLQEELQAEIAGVYPVGGLTPEHDVAALEALAGSAPGVAAVVLVQAWEPPVADYLDLLGRARKALGDGRLLVVLLHETDVEGRPTAAEERHLRLWRRQLAALGDPWLRVETLVTGQAP